MLTSPWFVLFLLGLEVLYYSLPGRVQWKLLLGASLAFYLWMGPEYLGFLLLTTVTTWLEAVRMDRNLRDLPPGKRREARGRNNGILRTYLLVNGFMLLLCKACLVRPFSALVEGGRLSFLTLGLPLGLSFYLFQSVGYVLDVYYGRGRAEASLPRVALFVSYFPQLIQGPVSRFSQLGEQLYREHPFNGKQVSFGIQRMLWGYFKKLVIADRVAPAVAVLRGPEGVGAGFGLLTLLYALQLYADFTGGIDIVLGLSQTLGIRLAENFRRPFFSKNTAEYWRRWHMTLGEWMKDYIFYPVSVSKPMLKLSKAARLRWGAFGKRLPLYLASGVTWLATGLWHGLTPNFVLWGMLNWGIITISSELEPLYAWFHSRFPWKEKHWYGFFEIGRMFLLMNLIRVCDLFPSPAEYFRRIGSLFSRASAIAELGLAPLDWGILGTGTAMMLLVSIFQERRGSLREWFWVRPRLRQVLMFALFLAVVFMGRYGVGYDASSFIYNQF